MPARPRMLAVVSRFKWMHINYLAALAEHFELLVGLAGEVHEGAVEKGIEEGLQVVEVGRVADDGVTRVSARLREAISGWEPQIVHLMYYRHEELTLLVRELIGDTAVLLYESRDPLTTLDEAVPGSEKWRLERAALAASDAQLFVTEAVRSYYERSHDLDLASTSLIVPQGFARRTIAPPEPKLSAGDGRVHIGLVGTADDAPDHGRWYGNIIRRLVDQELVVHSHFHDLERVTLEPYEALALELEDYHHHPTIPHRYGTAFSEAVSRYDLMGVFHELGAMHRNESTTLAVCLPTKAVCGWLHGAIPVVCFPHYRGVVEWIQALGIGFVLERWEDVVAIAADRAAIARATARCLACRDSFTNELNAQRIRRFVEPLLKPERFRPLRGREPRSSAPGARA